MGLHGKECENKGMANALVTGANGFIGSHLVRELLRRGYAVRGLVRPTSDLISLTGLPIALYLGDVCQPETLVAPVQGVEYIFHLAAELMVSSKQAFEEANAQGTANMLEVAQTHASDTLKRFLFVSSQAAAGPGYDRTPVNEERDPRPISWYGASKLGAEKHVRAAGTRLAVTIVRPSAVYGEREKDISQAFPMVARRVQPIMGLRTKHTVMVYVGDLIGGIVDAAESGSTLNETYFLNHRQPLTIKDAVMTIGEAMGKPRGLRIRVPTNLMRVAAPFAEFTAAFTRERPPITRDKVRELSQRYWVSDPSKAKRDFGWEAGHDLLQGMRITTRHWMDFESEIREMPLEPRGHLWLKYLLSSAALGALIESLSSLGDLYRFTPSWGAVLAALGFFGVILGTSAMGLRRRPELLQFLAGCILAVAAELANASGMPSLVSWQFRPGWPLGITDVLARSVLLSLAGGVFILLINAWMRLLYRRRIRFG